MAKMEKNPGDADDLRRRADEKLRAKYGKPGNTEELKGVELIVHELRVHQIELEMQNEALRTAQLDLEKSRDKYIELFDFAPVGYFTFTRWGIIREVNLTGASLLGVERKKLINRGFGQFVVDADLAAWEGHILNVVKSGEKLICELALKLEDGSIRYVRLESLRMAASDAHDVVAGEPSIIRTTVSDITERRRSEEFIKAILESVSEGVVVIDPEYRIISANRAYCEQIKLSCEKIVGRHCYEVSHHKDKPCFREGEECAPRLTFKTGEPRFSIHTHYDKDGNPIYIEERSSPMKDASGKVYAVIETLNNITEKRKLEEQLRHTQKMEAIGTLAGGIAHDFNNLLNVIIGYGGLMQMRMKPDDPMMHQLKEILAAGDRATYLTRGLLTFSRKQVMEIRTIDLNVIIEGFKKMLARIIGEDIELKVITPPPSAGALIVKADVVQIEQVLMNLSANARDAMPQGGALTIETRFVRIDREFVKMYLYGEPGEYGLITVSDTGTGMDEKTRARIFEPYFTTKDMGRGTGLGLAIVYGIVKQHGGYIHCYSEQGKGTTFRIYIPLVKAEAEKFVETEALVPKGGTETILVAEDDTNVRAFIKQVLEGMGYTVIEAVDGGDAVRKFRENADKIQLLLFDIIMPVKNGKDAYEDIRGIRHDIKALFMSGYTRDIVQRFGIEEGFEFISKPVMPGELLRKVREALDR